MFLQVEALAGAQLQLQVDNAMREYTTELLWIHVDSSVLLEQILVVR